MSPLDVCPHQMISRHEIIIFKMFNEAARGIIRKNVEVVILNIVLLTKFKTLLKRINANHNRIITCICLIAVNLNAFCFALMWL